MMSATTAVRGSRSSARSSGGWPIRLLLQQVARKAVNVVVRSPERSVAADHDAADGADAPREIVGFVDNRERALLVRNRQVAPGEAQRRERAQRRLEAVRPNRERNVRPRESVMIEEVVVQDW